MRGSPSTTPLPGIPRCDWSQPPPALPHAREGDYARAKAIVLEGIAAIGEHPELLYQLACCEAQLGEADAALDHINAAVRAGDERMREWARRDEELSPVRASPRFP